MSKELNLKEIGDIKFEIQSIGFELDGLATLLENYQNNTAGSFGDENNNIYNVLNFVIKILQNLNTKIQDEADRLD